ncbi:auxin-responsive protein IAA4-like isoform X2 [Dioscorea cayenensis subsp. rotundata]|uniref:Auxin-responsive protein n=1 Tax=Dioscorea cayennensis subsp. rotundata TaxID=55577 RepID=A0AB40CA47_DIOCR|nr:auxin-responsive protein IAA4-like isoform X2 [Dioscorea cayenensis subsp. rotundata]
MGDANSSPSSSIDSSSHPVLSTTSSFSRPIYGDLSTDLRLGLSISSSPLLDETCSNSREQASDWPPIKQLLRTALEEKINKKNQDCCFFVKVYMEGLPIGRKLDLFSVHSYDCLVKTLSRMFKTTILCSDVAAQVSSSDNIHFLTYEDKEGDWMMVGDVPWEMFLTSVKRLKITKVVD